jgi:hypothetical protein
MGRGGRSGPSVSSSCTDRAPLLGQAEFLSDRIDGLSRAEQVDHVVNGRTAAGEPWSSELVVGVDGHF